MAHETPEMAFLKSMQDESTAYDANQYNPETASGDDAEDSSSDDESVEASDADDDDEDEDEDEDAADEQNEQEQEQEQEQDEDEDYDPSALVTQSSTKDIMSANGTISAAPSTKARGKGGFVVDDSDEEDDNTGITTIKNGLNAASSLADVSRPVTVTPLNGTGSNDVQISRSEEIPSQDLSSTLNVPVSTVPINGAASSIPTPRVPNPTSKPSEQARSTVTMAKTRNPADVIGLLGDRIAEDERGDVDAWLQLIDEHRQKNNLEEARKVYERFFAVFPSAVSPPQVV